jgi:tryptophan-rich sensory protein
LYFLMALAIWNIWIKSNKLNLVYLYFIHLIFNTTWSIVFFGFKNIELALINLIVIILFIVILFLKYKDISKFSAYLMVPYFLWCSYALILNFNLMILN